MIKDQMSKKESSLKKGELMQNTIIRFLLLAIIVCYSSVSPKQIIFLNGTTTAGKSFTGRELKLLLEMPGQEVDVLSIDSFLINKLMLTIGLNRVNPWNMFVANENIISTKEMEDLKQIGQVELSMAAKTSYNQGKIVIIDAPIYEKQQVDFYCNTFNGFNVTWVLAYCPLQTLVARVIKRNQSSGITEQRSILQAMHQFSCLYTSESQQIVDTLSNQTLTDLCPAADKSHREMQAAIPSFLKGVQNAICPFDINNIQQSIVANCNLYQNDLAQIGPFFKHDIIVNTETTSPFQCAIDVFNKVSLMMLRKKIVSDD
jgi:chloramphenicol 3-O-phosphotransferase